MAERGLVDVEIERKGDGSWSDGQTRTSADVKIKTNRGDSVWVSEKDVIARKPNPEEKVATLAGPIPWAWQTI